LHAGKLGRVLLVATLLVLCMGTVSATNSVGNETVYYPLDDNCPIAEDSSGNNRDGSCVNNPTTGVSGVFDQAYSFNSGDDEYLDAGTGSHFDDHTFTITALVKPERLFSDDQNRIVDYFSFNDDGYQFSASTDNNLSFSSQGTDSESVSGNEMVEDKWQCVAVSYEQGSTNIYQNTSGTFENTASGNVNDFNDVNGDLDYLIGRNNQGGKNWDGKIDEYRHFETVLPGSDIEKLCNSNKLSSAPDFDSVSTEPTSWKYEKKINVSAEVSDDGSVSSVSGSWKYENGTEFDSFSLSNTGGTTWEKTGTGPINVVEENVTLELTATDNDGATSTYTEEQLISDKDAAYTLNQPKNKTNFDYDGEIKVTPANDDGDDIPNENYTCTFYRNGTEVGNATIQEGGSSYTESLRSDLGTYNFVSSCSDDSGLTENKTREYTVQDFEIEDTSTNSPVYETTNQSFTANLKAGEMVKSVETSLYWDGNLKDTETISNTGVNSFSQILRHETPLVQNNNTGKNWNFKIKYNYTDFNGNNQTTSLNSTEKTQQILWSYYLQQSFFTPDNKYIETEDLQHNTRIHTETKKADLKGTTTYKRDSSTDNMELVDSNTTQSTFRGVIDTGLADSFNQSTFQAESEITVDFNGNTRTINTGNDQLELYRIQLFDTANPGSLNTEKTLEFDIDYEEEGYDTKAEFTMDLSVWKNENEKIRRFQFQEPEAETHSYHIYPSWASYTIQTKPYPEQTKFDLIQYFNPDDNKVRRSYFFPVPQTISNQTTTVPLKTINESEATQIDFEVTQSGGQPAENVYCRVDRKFGGGDFETVFMIKTGSQGNSQSFAEVNEIYYSFTCYKNGEIIETFPAQIMQNPMILNIGETQTETQLDYSEEFDADCSFNQTSISCGYQSQTENLEYAKLEVDRVEPVTDIQVCNKTSPTATGTLTCNGINTSKDSYRYSLTGEYPGGINILGDSGKTGSQGSQYGAAGILLTLMIFLFVFAATAFNAPLGIALGTLSILFSSVAGFLALTPAMRATLIGLAILAGVLAHR
jgi:hypothetical protein